MRQLLYVESTGGHIGGHQQLCGAIAYARHHPVALLLAHPTMECLGPIPTTVHGLGELVHFGAGTAEHDGRSRCLHVEDAAQRRGLVRTGDDIGTLAYQCLARLGVTQADVNTDGITQVTLGNAVDTWRHGGREQHRLATGRSGLQDGLDVLGEAHVEHLIGLIEDHHLHIRQREGAPGNVIQGPTRRGHHHMHTGRQRLQLAIDGLATVDGHHLGPQVTPVLVNGFGHLHRQFPGRHQDEGDGGHLAAGGGDALQNREGEGGRLARTGGGLAHQVTALQQQRDGFALDGGGFLVAEAGQHMQEFGAQTQFGEAGGVVVVVVHLAHGARQNTGTRLGRDRALTDDRLWMTFWG